MPKKMIPLNTDPYENVDDVELREGQAAKLVNAYVDDLKNTKIRPGLSSKWDLSTDVTNPTYYTTAPLDGIFWWNSQKRLIIAANGSLYHIDSPYGAPVWIGSPTNLARGTPVIFADSGDDLLGANGTGLFYVNITAGILTAENVPVASEVIGTDGLNYTCIVTHTSAAINRPITGADYALYWVQTGFSGVVWAPDTAYIYSDPPTRSTHVGYLDGYSLANEDGATFRWSTPNNVQAWSSLDYATAEADPDNVEALLVNWREILLVGEKTTETWYNAGTTAPFGKLAGTHIEKGTSARYTVKAANNTWYWLDQDRRFITLVQRTPQVISGPFEKVIEGFIKVSDATTDVLDVGGQHWLILTFPSANRTFAYEYARKTWSEWSTWDPIAAADQEWRARYFCLVPDWGMCLAGDRLSSKIFDISPNYHDDDGDNIRILRRTGHISHDTHMTKRTNSLVIRCKRGVGSVAGSEPTMSVRWKSDNGDWSTPREVSLGKIGDDYCFVTLRGLGMYRSRQYEFVILGASDFILMDAEEDVDPLR